MIGSNRSDRCVDESNFIELNYRTKKVKNKIVKMFKSSKLVTQNSKDQSTPIASSSLLIKGYITKLKSKKKRYFVLYTENENQPAHLDYYENEKKFRTSPNLYKRSILLKDCFAVIKKCDPRFKKNNTFVFAIYTKDDCFPLMFDNQEEMNCWFSLIHEVHLKALAKNKNNTKLDDYDKIWFAVIKDKKSVIRGSFYLCLTSEEIHLHKINNESSLKDKNKRLSSSSDKSFDQQSETTSQQNSTSDKTDIVNQSTTEIDNASKDSLFSLFKDNSSKCNNTILRFPFSLIRSFGHQSNNFIIDLGRSSDIGSCQLSFELKDCDTSQHIHSLVASTRQAAKNSEFRTRSNSENSRMSSRRNKSLSDKQQSITHSKTTTSIDQQQSHQMNNSNSANSKSSSSLKFAHHKSITSCDSNKLVNYTKTNDRESSTEHVSSPAVAYTSVVHTLPSNNLPLRSRSTSESSTSHTTQFAQAKGLQNLLKAKQKLLNHSTQSSNSNLVSSTNYILSNESIQSIDSNDEKDSDYYMTTPNTVQPLPSACSIKEEDYLIVDDTSFEQQSITSPSRTNRTFSNASTVKLNSTNKLDQLRSSDLKLVSTTGPLAAKLTQQSSIENAQQHYKQLHSQYYSPINNSFVELPDPVVEELNENDQIDEYIQVELGAKKSSNTSNLASINTNIIKQITSSAHKLEVISSEPSSISESSNNKTLDTTSNTTTEQNLQQQQQHNFEEEEEDYIGIESFSSTNTANNNQENFEASNLSPISSASCNTNRIKTFSISSNNTSNNELNSLGTSPSLISNQFYNTTPVNHGAKEEIYKLEKVKSYFNSTEDCGDYIKPARTYSMGSRPQLANHHKFKYSTHCPSMTKSKSNTINGQTLASNQSLINHSSTMKVQCGHLNSNEQTCNHLDESVYSIDNRQRAYSMGSHSKAKKDMLLRKIRLNQLQRQENIIKKDDTIEDEETSEKCLSTPILADKDYTRNRSATFTSFANSSTASTSSKKTNEESSEEDDMMCIDLSKSAGFENEFNYSHNQISIKEKFKELSLDSDEMKANDLAKDILKEN